MVLNGGYGHSSWSSGLPGTSLDIWSQSGSLATGLHLQTTCSTPWSYDCHMQLFLSDSQESQWKSWQGKLQVTGASLPYLCTFSCPSALKLHWLVCVLPHTLPEPCRDSLIHPLTSLCALPQALLCLLALCTLRLHCLTECPVSIAIMSWGLLFQPVNDSRYFV